MALTVEEMRNRQKSKKPSTSKAPPKSITIPIDILSNPMLTPGTKLVYGALLMTGHLVTVEELSAITGLTAPTVRVSLQRLGAHGLLGPDPTED